VITHDRAEALAGPILVAVSAVSFGLMPLFSRWAERGGVALEMKLGLRFLIGAAILFLLAARERAPRPGGKAVLWLILLGGVVYFLEAYCYFAALIRGTPSGVVSLLLYLYPVSVTIGAWVIFRERIAPRRWAALVIAIIGLALTIGPAAFAASSTAGSTGFPGGAIGILLAVASGVCYAVYILGTSRLVTPRTALVCSTIVCASAAVVFMSVAVSKQQLLPATLTGWLGVALLGTISTAVALTAFLAGAARTGPVAASTISIIEPVTTTTLGAAFLGERVGLWQILGGTLILLGAVIAARAGRSRNQ
jgi:drug/metabolite transporter (DMT)-like permease